MKVSIMLTGLHFKDLTEEEKVHIYTSSNMDLHIEEFNNHMLVSGDKSKLYDLIWCLSCTYDLTIK